MEMTNIKWASRTTFLIGRSLASPRVKSEPKKISRKSRKSHGWPYSVNNPRDNFCSGENTVFERNQGNLHCSCFTTHGLFLEGNSVFSTFSEQ